MADNNPIINKYSGKHWFINDKHHRVDGPAVEYTNGDKVWCQNGLRHRTDGPAIDFANGYKEWYIDGKKYSFKDWLQLCSLSYEEKCELVLIYG